MSFPKHNRGFTLIELLTVITVISILSSLVIATTATARIRARDAIRGNNLKTLEIALQSYFDDHGEYPKTFDPGDYWERYIPNVEVQHPDSPKNSFRECEAHNTYPDHGRDYGSEYIPFLVPQYIAKLPTDPALNCTEGSITKSWEYASDGRNYKLITHSEGTNLPELNDPVWDGGEAQITFGEHIGENGYCYINDKLHPYYGIWSEGGTCWNVGFDYTRDDF